MASLKEQVIPPELAEAYLRALGTVRPNTYPGGIHPDHLQNAQQTGRGRPEPPFIPTQTQLFQRAIFKAASNCFNATPQNERRAYYRLSKITGLEYRNYYLSRHILAYLAGATCAELRRPNAMSLKSELNYNHGGVYVNIPYEDAGTGRIEIETDATPIGQNPYWCSEGPFSLLDMHIDKGSPPYDYVCSVIQTWEPTERTRTEIEFEYQELPPPVWEWDRYLIFWRNGLAWNETVVWKFDLPEAIGPLHGWGFD